MDNQPQGALGPLPSSAPKPMTPPAPMQMPKPMSPPPAPMPKVMTPPSGPMPKPPMQPAMPPKEVHMVNNPMPDAVRRSGGSVFMMGLLIVITVLMAAGFLVLYFRIDAMQLQMKTFSEKATEDFGATIGKLNVLLDADAKREAGIIVLKNKMGVVGASLIEKGDLLKADGEIMKKEGDAMKSSEAAKTDAALMKRGEDMVALGEKLLRDGDAMKLEGQQLQTDATATTP